VLGVTSPIYQSKVLGEFPDVSDDTLIQPKWIEAQKRPLERNGHPLIAADIARFGEDETVMKAAGFGSTAPTTRPTP
jgi:hypothetical protein